MTEPVSPSGSHDALRFGVLIGITSLFADFTYEAGRSVNGQFLLTLGASATVVGLTAGFGELIGYGLRSIFGWIPLPCCAMADVDRTGSSRRRFPYGTLCSRQSGAPIRILEQGAESPAVVI